MERQKKTREKNGVKRKKGRRGNKEKRIGAYVRSEEHKATNTNRKTPDLPPVCITVD